MAQRHMTFSMAYGPIMCCAALSIITIAVQLHGRLSRYRFAGRGATRATVEATDGTREQHEEQSAVDGSLSTVPTVGSSDPTPATTFTSKVEEHERSDMVCGNMHACRAALRGSWVRSRFDGPSSNMSVSGDAVSGDAICKAAEQYDWKPALCALPPATINLYAQPYVIIGDSISMKFMEGLSSMASTEGLSCEQHQMVLLLAGGAGVQAVPWTKTVYQSTNISRLEKLWCRGRNGELRLVAVGIMNDFLCSDCHGPFSTKRGQFPLNEIELHIPELSVGAGADVMLSTGMHWTWELRHIPIQIRLAMLNKNAREAFRVARLLAGPSGTVTYRVDWPGHPSCESARFRGPNSSVSTASLEGTAYYWDTVLVFSRAVASQCAASDANIACTPLDVTSLSAQRPDAHLQGCAHPCPTAPSSAWFAVWQCLLRMNRSRTT